MSLNANEIIVKLNLRGTKFETLASTLSKNGYYFFDRNPEFFQHILDFLTKDKLEGKMTERELLNLEDEAKFFKVKELATLVRARLDNIAVKVNVSGEIFHVSRSNILKYPDFLLAKYLQGEEIAEYDSVGNIYLDRDSILYNFIFQYLKFNCKVFCKSRPDKNYPDFKNEVDFLNLTSLSIILDEYKPQKSFIVLKENIKLMPESKLKVFSSDYVYFGRAIEEKIRPYGYYLDITEEQCDLLLQHWDALVRNITRRSNNLLLENYEVQTEITELAQKLNIIGSDDRVVIRKQN